MATTYFQRSLLEHDLLPAGTDARHVEGYIRLEYATLSHLSWSTIRREVKIALACIREGGVEAAERNALSFGLWAGSASKVVPRSSGVACVGCASAPSRIRSGLPFSSCPWKWELYR